MVSNNASIPTFAFVYQPQESDTWMLSDHDAHRFIGCEHTLEYLWMADFQEES